MITLTIPGDPIGKARPRFVRKTGHTFTPDKTVNYETLIRELFAVKYPDHQPMTGPVWMEVVAHMRIPSSKSKKVKTAMIDGLVFPTVKPDADNLLKVFADAMNGLAYMDDKQIVSASVSKRYSERPRAEVEVKEYTEEDFNVNPQPCNDGKQGVGLAKEEDDDE